MTRIKYYRMKNLFTIIIVLSGLGLSAQPYNNEWINFSNTYYKFKVGSTGLYRIAQPVLASAGLGNVPVQNFQLFRNGVEVPIYTTAASGTLGSNDYIEFWGQMNDGVPDAPLYRAANYQLTQHKSLETDTAVYFLTVNATGNTFHYQNAPNNPSGSPLPTETYFMYTAGVYFHNQINPGFAQVVGEALYSSAYDLGEFWSSNNIFPGTPFTDNSLPNLYVYSGGPAASIKFGMVGDADDTRTVAISVNGTVVGDTVMNSYNDWESIEPVPLTLISSGIPGVTFTNSSGVSTDWMVASFYELNYPRTYDFGAQETFPFQLPAKSAGYLLSITDVPLINGYTPVLYDMTNGLRYTAVVNPNNSLSFVLPGSSSTTQLVLVNEDPATVQSVTGFTAKNFTNYAAAANQGNYIIIANSLLYTDGTPGDNPVQDYKTYRNSAAGGSFNTTVVDISDLIDQFAFGIKIHPLSIQNFLRYARTNWAAPPQDVLLIGHSMTYDQFNAYSEQNHDPLTAQLDEMPTWGYPASDNMLAAANGASTQPLIPIGRLSVINGSELAIYLQKVEQYEQEAATAPSTIAGRLWMKNVVQLTGVSTTGLGTTLCNYMVAYQQIITDTLCGDNVSLFCDGNATTGTTVPPSLIAGLFSTGMSLLNYFGHSSNTVLDYGLDQPTTYNNQDKYPIFLVNGCDAGDYFIYDPLRPSGQSMTLSETWDLANQRGSAIFVAASSFQIVNYVNIYLTGAYNLMDGQDYGKPFGQLEDDALAYLLNAAPGDYYARIHVEQFCLNGDPALHMYQMPTDYDVEASTVSVNPSFISTSNTSFTVNAKFYNLGKAISDSVGVLVTRTYPNGTTATIYSGKLWGLWYADSIQVQVPIVPTRDIGNNLITVTIDPGNLIPEVTYSNNTVTVDAYIYQNGATPAYPYNYAIINTPTATLVASTNNPILPSAQYTMQIDTTQLFNSPLLVTKTLTQIGGELEFNPGITFMDSVVYYWRVAATPAVGQSAAWAGASFVYIDPTHSTVGMNQSHYFQHLGSTGDSIVLAPNRQWQFGAAPHSFYVTNAMYPYYQYSEDFEVGVDGNNYIQSACVGHSFMFNVFNPVTLTAWMDVDANGNNLYLSGSGSANCATYNYWDFEFSYMTPASRYLAMRFLDSVPNGYYIVVRSFDCDSTGGNSYAATWSSDQSIYGAGNSIYNVLKNAGFAAIDSVNYPRDWFFVYKKNDNTFTPVWKLSQGLFDMISQYINFSNTYYSGTILSPIFGPAKSWGMVHWRGHDLTNPVTDTVGLKVVGVDTLGNYTTLYQLPRTVQDFNISAINAQQYPNIQLRLATEDSINAKPYQLDYWRLNYTPVPEGAIAPNIYLKAPDTVVLGQPIEFAVAFKDISPYAFDSMTIQMYILDAHNVTHTILLPKRRPIVSGDTLILDYIVSSTQFPGANTVYVNFNPKVQPEQYYFNNFLYKTVYVKGDSRAPTLDVTFDNVHILNNDIVSAKPHILIKLTSQSQYLLLKDTTLITTQVQYPDGSLHNYYFSGDTVKFTPATNANNNVATVDFTPAFSTQSNPNGDVYQLIVTGKDELGTMAGTGPYRVGFTVINKPMISNVFNYPNPFSTSTAFVFTVTGSQVPQNIKIQILTITGKVVREITKEELGPLHVGTNITEYKWNGTDMYGNRLANGVYLYHVVTNLNGQSLSKYNEPGANTNVYFNNGYGKMYLMR
jgi:Peptidase family C25/CARDB